LVIIEAVRHLVEKSVNLMAWHTGTVILMCLSLIGIAILSDSCGHQWNCAMPKQVTLEIMDVGSLYREAINSGDALVWKNCARNSETLKE
jgi:hypothetical protein